MVGMDKVSNWACFYAAWCCHTAAAVLTKGIYHHFETIIQIQEKPRLFCCTWTLVFWQSTNAHHFEIEVWEADHNCIRNPFHLARIQSWALQITWFEVQFQYRVNSKLMCRLFMWEIILNSFYTHSILIWFTGICVAVLVPQQNPRWYGNMKSWSPGVQT